MAIHVIELNRGAIGASAIGRDIQRFDHRRGSTHFGQSSTTRILKTAIYFRYICICNTNFGQDQR